MVSCWIGYFYDDKVKRILDIPEKLNVEGIFPIGLKINGKSEIKKRKPELDNLIFFNEYNNKEYKNESFVRNDWV
jgi:nitroreductase